MALPLLQYEENLPSNSLNLGRMKKNSQLRNNYSCLKSSGAVAFTVFVYFAIFYVFDLSPSSVVRTTKFWFVISNTLVIIIATDLTAFLKTTSYEHNQFHDESLYLKRLKYDERTVPKCPEVAIDGRYELPEKVIGVDSEKSCNDNNEKNLEFEIYKPQISNTSCSEGNGGGDGMIKKCERSNSDGTALMAAASENQEKMVLQRTLSSDRREAPPAPEENELSTITNEELNRRVEDFIRKFNREIRLQAADRRCHDSSEPR